METSIQLIVSKIEELITATGGGIKMYYPYVVRQQILMGIIPIITLVLSFILLVLGIKLGLKHEWNETIGGITGGISALIGGVGAFISSVCMILGLMRMLNPHYYAVQAIIDMGSRLIP